MPPVDRDENPDVNKFLTDPRYAADRALITASVEAHLQAKAESAAQKRKEGKPAEGFLEKLFHAILPDEGGEQNDNPFDVLFGGKRRR